MPASFVTLCVSGVIIQLRSHGNSELTHALLQFLPLFVCLMPLGLQILPLVYPDFGAFDLLCMTTGHYGHGGFDASGSRMGP